MTDCTFCLIASGELEPDSVAYEDRDVVAFMSRGTRPNNRGHAAVIPRVHVETIYDLPDELAGPLMRGLAAVARGVKRAFDADGVTIRQHNEPAGGQRVPHLHFHVVPRFADDDFPSWGSVDLITEAERAELAAELSQAMHEAGHEGSEDD